MSGSLCLEVYAWKSVSGSLYLEVYVGEISE